ncbi:DUF6207 family protein [Streptomyces sp. NPDC052020]|uniref:DUF6207 family protein n=1 Tax=Streptomyces sp. NPDC052020 TaxID=3155677 RepID=UPI00343A3B85
MAGEPGVRLRCYLDLRQETVPLRLGGPPGGQGRAGLSTATVSIGSGRDHVMS